jgi:hypothetical protein
MDNPLGGIKSGWDEIQEVYARIFGGPGTVYVEYYDYTIHDHYAVFYALGRNRDGSRRTGRRSNSRSAYPVSSETHPSGGSKSTTTGPAKIRHCWIGTNGRSPGDEVNQLHTQAPTDAR